MHSPSAERIATEADARFTDVLSVADAHREQVLGDAYHGRRVADVLAHLHAWQVMFAGWIAQHQSGAVPAFPAEGYSWEDLRALNDRLYEQHRDRAYDVLRAQLVTSHDQMVASLADFSEDELTDPAAFGWLGGESLGSVAHECLGGHYDWAITVFDAAGLRAE